MSARAAAWLAAVGCLVGSGAADAGFRRRNLAVPGHVLWVANGDINGDGLIDMVVSFRRGAGPAAGRYLGVFVRRPVGLRVRPDLQIPAPKAAAAFDLGDVDGDGADDLVYLMSSGVFFQKVGAVGKAMPRVGPLQRIVASPTLVVVPEEEDIVTWDFLRVIAPDEPPTLVVPGRRRLRLFRRTGASWTPWSSVELWQWSYYDAESDHYRPSGRGGSSGRPYAFRVTTIVPNIDFLDQTGDGRPDLVTHYEDRIAVHAANDKGRFSDKPTLRQWLQVRNREELESRDQRVSGHVQDLDGDGVADFVVSKIGGGITTLKTEMRLFRGRRGGGFETAPAQVFKDRGFASLARFIDIDGDGQVEMVHPHAAVSIMGMTRAMLSSSLGIDVRIRRPASDGRFFEKAPKQTLDISIGLDLSSGAALRGAAPLFGYDFNSDGYRDVVVPDGGDKMVVHLGWATKRGRGWFNKNTRLALDAPGSNATRALPVSASKPPEILVYYPYRKALSGRLVIFQYVPE